MTEKTQGTGLAFKSDRQVKEWIEEIGVPSQQQDETYRLMIRHRAAVWGSVPFRMSYVAYIASLNS